MRSKLQGATEHMVQQVRKRLSQLSLTDYGALGKVKGKDFEKVVTVDSVTVSFCVACVNRAQDISC